MTLKILPMREDKKMAKIPAKVIDRLKAEVPRKKGVAGDVVI